MCENRQCLCGASCHAQRSCSGHKARQRRCLFHGCNKLFTPECGVQVFCSEACRQQAGFDDTTLAVTVQLILGKEPIHTDRRKQQVKQAKKKFYRTEKGILAKSVENKRYYAKKRGQRQIQTPASLDGESS